MHLKHLNIFLKTRKALRKYNAEASFQVTHQRLSYLLIIYTMQQAGRPTGNKALFKGLESFGISLPWQQCVRHQKELLEAGLTEKDGHNTLLTVKGIAVLQRINVILSRQRLDA